MAEPSTAARASEERPSSELPAPSEYMSPSAADCRPSRVDDMETHPHPEETHPHESSAVTQLSTVLQADESQHVEVHEDCQSAIPLNGMIMMVTKSGLSEFDDRLSILAQRLQEHREAYPSHLEDEGMPPGHGSRSSTSWMAMPWRAPSWQGAGEWIGDVASMLSMRSTSSLRDQGQGDWTDQGNWPATRSSKPKRNCGPTSSHQR